MSTNIKEKNSSTMAMSFFMWGIAAVFYGLDYLQHTVPSVLIEPISISIGVNYVDIATIMSIYFPIYALSQIPAGYLIDKYGVKQALGWSCLLVSLGLFCMLASSVSTIIIGRILIAVGSAFAFIGALKTISIWFVPKYFSLFVGITQSIGVLGGLTGQVFINYLIETQSWQGALFNIALFGVVWSLVIFFLLKNKPSAATPLVPVSATHQGNKKNGNFFSIIRDKNIWLLAIYAAIMVGTVMNTFAELYDVVFLKKSLHMSSQQATYITMFIFIGVGVGAPLHGIISYHFSKQSIWMRWCALMTLIVFLLIPIASIASFTTSILIPIYFLLGFFVSSMLLSFSIARCCYPIDSHGTIFALVNTIIGFGGFLFPLVFGKVIKIMMGYVHFHDELLMPLFLLSIPLLVSLLFTFFIKEWAKACSL
ncbi:MAG: transporter [Gammaproteobacteria bacterium]|jgi:MFS family permease|nr:transporter [Gammaproteobacteria bacterium]